MQTARILQAVVLMMVVALAASCATSNQYVSKLFGPRPVAAKDSQQLVRFLELDSLNAHENEWVKTDITKKDTVLVSTTPAISDPVARTGNPDGTRTKKTRE
jgi:hypothetical protein